MGNTLALIALAVSILNACTALTTFVLNRIRLPKVRYIGTMFNASGPVTSDESFERHLTVDVLNSGAAIWDLEVWVEVFVPPWADRGKAQAKRMSIALEPVGKRLNPLNSGQAIEFILSSNIFRKHTDFTGKVYDHLAKTTEDLKHVPRRYVSLCLYTNGRRKVLKRIRSKRFLWELDCFFGHPLKAPVPMRNRLSIRLFEWSHSKDAQRIRSFVDGWRKGYFDWRLEQLRSFIGGEHESPDRVRPRPNVEEQPRQQRFL